MVSTSFPPQGDSAPSFVSAQSVHEINLDIEMKLQGSSIPKEIPFAQAPSYAERFKSSLRNLRKISDPSTIENGILVVQAPPEVLLKTADLWKDHLVAQFHGRIPSPERIFNDLNPIWGKFGNITVRKVSESSCLILSREWALQVGYWQVDNCAFSVFPWTHEGNLAALELQFVPTWAIMQNVPPQLYCLDGIVYYRVLLANRCT